MRIFSVSVSIVIILFIYSLPVYAQPCNTVKFNNIAAASPYTCANLINLKATDSLLDNGISPGFSIKIQRDQNTKNDNVIRFYVNGTLSDTKYPPQDQSNYTIYASHLVKSYTYRIEWCDNNGQGVYPWSLYNHAGNVLMKSGVFNFAAENKTCLSVTITNLSGVSEFSGVGVYDYGNGTAIFNPAVSGPGIFDITYTWDDEHGCRSSSTQTITVIGPKASAGNDIFVCRGNAVKIGGNPTASGGAGNFKYVWSPVKGLNSSTVSNPNATPQNTTSYIVTVIDNLGKGCKAVDTVNVTIKNNPEVSAGKDTSLCKGNNIVLKAKGGINYKWSNDAISSEISISPDTSIVYIVTITDINSCSSIDSIKVDVYPFPKAEFESKPGNAPFAYDFTSNSIAAVNYLWKFGDGTTSTDRNPQHTYKDSKGKHTVTLVVDNGTPEFCLDSISHEVIGSEITKIPDVFAPDGDKNKNFVMEASGLQSIEIIIFNRWGEKIFNKSSVEYVPSNNGKAPDVFLWDGISNNGLKVDAGTYFYVIKATGVDSKPYNEKGSITLIK